LASSSLGFGTGQIEVEHLKIHGLSAWTRLKIGEGGRAEPYKFLIVNAY